MPNKELFMQDNFTDVIFIGGGAGSGKTQALVDKCIGYVEDPLARVVIFSENLACVDGLLDVCRDTFSKVGATYSIQTKQFKFENGAVLSLKRKPDDMLHLAGSRFTHVCIDEVCREFIDKWTEADIINMIGKLRHPEYTGKRQLILTGNPNRKSFVYTWVKDLLGKDKRPSKYVTQITKYFGYINNEVLFGTKEELKIKGIYHPISFKFIPLSLFENTSLLEAHPTYLDSIQSMPAALQDKLLYGSWKKEIK